MIITIATTTTTITTITTTTTAETADNRSFIIGSFISGIIFSAEGLFLCKNIKLNKRNIFDRDRPNNQIVFKFQNK